MSNSIQNFQSSVSNGSLLMDHPSCMCVVRNPISQPHFEFNLNPPKALLDNKKHFPQVDLGLNPGQNTVGKMVTIIKNTMSSISKFNLPNLLPGAHAKMQNPLTREQLEKDIARFKMKLSNCNNEMVQDSPIKKTDQIASPTLESITPTHDSKERSSSSWGNFMIGALTGSMVTFLITTVGMHALNRRLRGSYSPVKHKDAQGHRQPNTITVQNIPLIDQSRP